MSSIYTPRPAYQDLGGFIVLLSIVKRFPAFLHCEALFFASEGDRGQVREATSPLEFRDGVASLPVNAVFGPISGGVPLILYVSKPGFEEDFKEVAGDISVSGYDLVRAAPDADNPYFLIFGRPADLLSVKTPPAALAPAEPAAALTVLAEPAPAAATSVAATSGAEMPRETGLAPLPDLPSIEVLPSTPALPEAVLAPPAQPAVETAPSAVPAVLAGGQAEHVVVTPEVLVAMPVTPPEVAPQPSVEMTPESRLPQAAPLPVEQLIPDSVPLYPRPPDSQYSSVAPAQVNPLLSESRRSDFDRLLRSIRALTAEGKPEALAAALQLYDRAAVDYGDLWGGRYDAERVAIAERLAQYKLGEAKNALRAGQWGAVIAALAQAVTCPATYGEALALQAALWAYLRGEVEKAQGDNAAAAASFSYAAAHCAELRERAGALAQAAKQETAQSRQDLGQHLTDQQAALLSGVEAHLTQMQEQMANRQLTVARQVEAEQSERQMTSLRHLQQEQATQLQALLVKLQNEQSEWQQETFKALERDRQAHQQTQVERPAWYASGVKELGRAVTEQGEGLQAALKAQQDQIIALQKTISEWRSQRSAGVDEPTLAPDLGPAVSELAWKVETGSRAVKGISTRLGVLFALFVLLLLALAAGFVWSTAYYGSALAALRPAPTPTYNEGQTATPPLAILLEPTVALTGVALHCADTDRGQVYYDCTLGNGVAYPQALSLSIAAEAGKENGFFPSVTLGDKPVYPDLSTTLAPLGRFEVGQLKRFRLNLPCAAALGCAPTTFVVRVVDSQASVVPGSEILITTASPAP